MPITHLPSRESGKQFYIMVGDQIKYEPAWLPRKSVGQDTLKTSKVNDCLRSATAGLNTESLERVK